MTRKDYEVIARVFAYQMSEARKMSPSTERTCVIATLAGLCERMCGVFAVNPRFKEEVFMNACGF